MPIRSLLQCVPIQGRVVLAMCLLLPLGCVPEHVVAVEEQSTRLAMTSFANARPTFLLASLDGREASAVHFTNVADDVPGNDATLAVRDDALLDLAAPRWSPSGKKVALVATLAFDQSLVVIYDTPTGTARVGSPNTQIIGGSVDWSPTGTAIAYTMSTLPTFTGIDLFVTDLATNQITRLTSGADLSLSSVRFDQGGSGVYYSTRTHDQGEPPFNSVTLVAHVNVVSKKVDTLRTGIVGDVQAISRTGAWALVLRNLALDGARYRRDLLRIDLATGAELPLITNETLESAQLGADDSRGVVAVNVGVSGAHTIVFDLLDLVAGRRDRIPGAGGAIHVDISPRSLTRP